MNYHAAKAFILNKLAVELADDLTYHGLHHTLDVLRVTEELCFMQQVAPYEEILLKTGALFHDSGFTINNKNHEELGCQIARDNLPRFGYTHEEIERICSMILATKVPQTPQNPLEEIICDADLDYLGRDDFYSIGATLFQELKTYKVLETEENWNRIQVKFLQSHHFFTEPTRRRRMRKKQEHLDALRAIVASYESI